MFKAFYQSLLFSILFAITPTIHAEVLNGEATAVTDSWWDTIYGPGQGWGPGKPVRTSFAITVTRLEEGPAPQQLYAYWSSGGAYEPVPWSWLGTVNGGGPSIPGIVGETSFAYQNSFQADFRFPQTFGAINKIGYVYLRLGNSPNFNSVTEWSNVATIKVNLTGNLTSRQSGAVQAEPGIHLNFGYPSPQQTPSGFEVVFPDRTVPATGGTLTATVYSDARAPFTFGPAGTPWLTAQNQGTGETSGFDPATGKYSGTAPFTAAAHPDLDKSLWYEPRTGAVTIQGQNFDVTQESAGIEIDSIKVSKPHLVGIGYRLGEQLEQNSIGIFYSVSGGDFTAIPSESITGGAGHVGANVAPGVHHLTWDAQSVAEAQSEEVEVQLRIVDADGWSTLSEVFKLEPSCEGGCQGGSCRVAGKPQVKTQSIDVQIPLGVDAQDRSYGKLWIHEKTASDALRTPAALWRQALNGAQTFPTNATSFSQVLTPVLLADIVDPDPADDSWSVRFFDRMTQLGPFNANTGVYDQSAATPFQTITFTVADDASGMIQSFTVAEAGTLGNHSHVFTWSPEAAGRSTWALEQRDAVFGVLRREQVTRTTSPDGRTHTMDRRILEADGTLAERTVTTEQVFPFGKRTTQEERFIVQPNGTAAGSRSTFFVYGQVAGQPGYGRLIETYTDYDGTWIAYTYSASGVASIRRPYRDAGRGSADDQVELTTITWHRGNFGMGATEDLAKITTRSQAGNVVSRVVEIFYKDVLSGTLSDGITPFTFKERWSIVLTDPSVNTVAGALATSSSLITKTRVYASGADEDQTRSILRPDGTITISEYAPNETTEWSGVPALDGHSITEGVRSERVTNDHGEFVASQSVALPQNLVTEEEVALAHDAFGRPTEIQHLDGSHSFAEYSCCGLARETGRDGVVTTYVRDMLGRVRSQTRLGVTTTFDLSATGRIRSVTDSGGGLAIVRSMTSTDSLGTQTVSTDARNRSTVTTESFAANGARQVTTISPDGGTRVETTFLDGQPRSVRGTAVRPVDFDYGFDAAQGGSFTKEIRVGENGTQSDWTTTFSDMAARVVKVIQNHENGAPSVSTHHYNTLGQRERSVDPDGVVTLFSYNALGESTATATDMDRDGVIDLAGPDRVTSSTTSWSTRAGKTVRKSEQQVYLTDGAATATTVQISESSVDGLDTWSTVSGQTSHSQTVLQGNGNTTVTVTAPDGTKEVTVTTAGRRASVTQLDANGAQITRTEFGYDGLGRITSETDARTGATTLTWYDDDQIASITTPDPGDGSGTQTTAFTYDAAGRIDLTTLPDNGVVDRNYFPTGDLQSESGARTYPVSYTYDPQGRMRTLTTAGGVTTWTYHPESGRLEQKIHGDGHGPVYAYTAAGRPLTRVSGRGVTTTYGFDNGGALAAIDYSDATPDVIYTHTRRGQVATVTRAGSTTAYTYNLAGQGESETITGGILDGVVIDPGHDALLRRTSLNAGGAGWTYQQTYGFDTAGRLDAIGFGDHSFSYGYLPNSNLIQTVTSRTAGNDILTATKTWDNLNRLYRIQSTSTATVGGLSQTFTYAYNRTNQRTGVTREDGTRWDYGYDALGQVTGAVNREADGDPLLGREFGYAYDNIGNRTSATFGNNHTIGYTRSTGDGTQYASITTPGISVVTGEVDPTATVAINGTPAANRQSGYFSHELTLDNAAAPAAATVNVAATLGGTTETQQREAFVPKAVVNPEYDFDGNLTFDGFLEYAWDAENRLIGVRTRPGLAPAGSSWRDFRQEMTYDHASRRIRCTTFVKINGTEHRASDDAYVYDGWNQIAVLNALTRQPRQTYAWGLDLSGSLQGAGGVGGLLAVRDVPSGDTHFVNRDVNGNVMGLVDAGSGALTASYEYDAFGNLLAMEGSFAALNPWRFSTKTVDRFTGHYYYGYRFYDPVAGRWLSRDPIEETGGYNLYGFVANATLVTVDPLGLRSIAPPGGVSVSSTFSTTSGGVNPSAFSTGGGGFSSTFTSAGGGTLSVSPVAGSASVGAGSSAVFGTPLVPIALVGVAVYAWTPHGQGLIDDLITEPWVDFLSYKSPSLDWSDDLPMPEDLLDIPDLDLRRPPKPCKRKCRFDWPPAPQRIDDASIWQRRTAGPRELKVTTPEGLWEQFDGGVDSGSTDPKIAIEAKSGYGFLLRPQLQWTDNQHATYLRVLAQLMRQWYVAHRCGLKWEIHVDNPDGKAGIAGRYPFAAPYITKP